MKRVQKDTSTILNSYIDENRRKIDEALVSLRLMKKIDDFLYVNQISQKQFSNKIGCSESYISQLMSGVKKINTRFINKFEKSFGLKVDFDLKLDNSEDYLLKVSDTPVTINVNMIMGNYQTTEYLISAKSNAFLRSTSQSQTTKE